LSALLTLCSAGLLRVSIFLPLPEHPDLFMEVSELYSLNTNHQKRCLILTTLYCMLTRQQVCRLSHRLAPKIQSLPAPALSPASLTTVFGEYVPMYSRVHAAGRRCPYRRRYAGFLWLTRPIQGRASSRRLRVSHHRWRCWRFERFSGLYVAIRICSILTFINSGHQRSAG
jgi:hypothetical protein